MKKILKTVLFLFIALVVTNCKQKSPTEVNSVTEKDTLNLEIVEKVSFQKTLSLQGITFDVSTTGEGSIRKLTITTKGLTNGDENIQIEIDGQVTNAEVEDLNSDASPELLIYTTSAGSGSYGNVLGYSVNNQKSISSITFPDIMENAKASAGYMGHDEFSIVETYLMRKFPVYGKDDSNANPTDKFRLIKYGLENGEASRKFVIKDIMDLGN